MRFVAIYRNFVSRLAAFSGVARLKWLFRKAVCMDTQYVAYSR